MKINYTNHMYLTVSNIYIFEVHKHTIVYKIKYTINTHNNDQFIEIIINIKMYTNNYI
jgi:hypothetical protein